MTHTFPRRLALATLIALTAAPAAAQVPFVQATRQIRTRTVEGEVKNVKGSRVFVEIDGETGPIPVDRNTRLNVAANGDRGFLTPGAVVVVNGTLRPDGTIAGASFTLHPDPKNTVTETARKVNAADPQITVAGRLVSLEPFVIKAIDPIAVVKPDEQNVGAFAPGGIDVVAASGKRGLVLTVKLRDGLPEEVRMQLGSSPALIAPGDWAAVTFGEDNPNAARAVNIRKTESLKSPASQAAAAKDAKEDKKAKGNKADAKEKDAAPE